MVIIDRGFLIASYSCPNTKCQVLPFSGRDLVTATDDYDGNDNARDDNDGALGTTALLTN